MRPVWLLLLMIARAGADAWALDFVVDDVATGIAPFVVVIGNDTFVVVGADPIILLSAAPVYRPVVIIGHDGGQCFLSDFNATVGCIAQSIGPACDCVPGHYYNATSDQCLACAAGTFKAEYGRASFCQLCDANTSTLGLHGQSGCWPCDPATSHTNGQPGQADCVECVWPMVVSGDECLCAPGTAREGTRCLPCPAGSFAARIESAGCEPCSPRTWTAMDSGNAACTSCLAGAYSLPTGECALCARGTFQALDNASACVLCEGGAYASGAGQTSCLVCGGNNASHTPGATVCYWCPAYSVPFPVIDGCECIAGALWDASGKWCVPCAAGTYAMDVAGCMPCAAGAYSTGLAQTVCAQCAAGQYTLAGGATECQTCDAGLVTVDNACACPPGMFNNDGPTSFFAQCANCTGGCVNGSTFVAQACTQWSDLVCQPCTPGCSGGYYIKRPCMLGGDLKCNRCSMGCISSYYMASACMVDRDLTCAPCATHCALPGYVVTRACTVTSDLHCEACPAGTYAANRTGCAPCADGFISPEAAGACIPCTTAMADSLHTLCMEQCGPGFYPIQAATCAPCPSMTYGPDGRGCMGCLSHGYGSAGGQSSCP